jgi:hypothetical protein
LAGFLRALRKKRACAKNTHFNSFTASSRRFAPFTTKILTFIATWRNPIRKEYKIKNYAYTSNNLEFLGEGRQIIPKRAVCMVLGK